MGSSGLPESLGVPPIGCVIGERKNVLPKALLSEAFLAGGRHLAEPVVVSATVVDRHKAHRHDAATSPLGRPCLGEVYVDGPAAIGPRSAITTWRWQAHGACWAVVRDVSIVRTAEGVATMDTAPFSKFSCKARERPWVFLFRAPPSRSSYMALACRWMLGAVVKVVVGSIVQGSSVGELAMTTGVRLIGQPRLGVVDPLASCRVLHGGVALNVVVPDFIKRESVPILPDWGPHHPAVPENVGHAGKDEDRQHLGRDHPGRDSLM